MTRSSNYASSERSYFGTDLMGTVRSSTTDSGNAEYYEYDVFGKPYGENVSDYAYTGKPYDPVTGMYNYGYRDYVPQTARFTTIDPIRDGNNWFAYCNNEPVNFQDAWGLEAVDPFDNPRDAAQDALAYINPKSVKENREYGGLIYQDPDDEKYYASKPVKGSEEGVNPWKSKVPKDSRVVGDYHTHADYAIQDPNTGKPVATGDPGRDDYDSDNFSTTDLRGIESDAKRLGEPEYTGYLGTPGGDMKEFKPSSNTQPETTGTIPRKKENNENKES